MTEHYHAAIWIDHREARVFHFSPTEVEAKALTPGRKLQNTEPSCVFFARRGRKQ